MAELKGILETSSDLDREGNRTHTIKYLIEVDIDAGEGSFEASSVAGLPAAGQAHPSDFQAIADSVKTNQVSDDGRRFTAEVTYTNIVTDTGPDSQSSGPGSSPTDAAVSLEGWSTESVAGVLGEAYKAGSQWLDDASFDQDATILSDFSNSVFKTRVQNHAYRPYEERIEFDSVVPVITFVRNESSFGFDFMYEINNSVNETTFLGARPGTIRARVEADHKWKNGENYYEVTYRFTYNPHTWFQQVFEKSELVFDETRDIPDGGSTTGNHMKPHEVPTKTRGGGKEIDGFVFIDEWGFQLGWAEAAAGTNPPDPYITGWTNLTGYDYNTLGLN